jgi:hypothetical protein
MVKDESPAHLRAQSRSGHQELVPSVVAGSPDKLGKAPVYYVRGERFGDRGADHHGQSGWGGGALQARNAA